jgi:hypothetical protein
MLWELIAGAIGLLPRARAFPPLLNQEDVFEALQEEERQRTHVAIVAGLMNEPEAIEYIVASLQEKN